jgi:BirA family biotin operon repressor/biotin-[acetyl-CoA-carboxylase] ligase
MPNFRKILENSFISNLEYYELLSSTNDRALAAAGEPDVRLPLLIVADAQTAGRGRGSNRWWTGSGSLAFSLLMQPVGWVEHGDSVEMVRSANRSKTTATVNTDSTPCVTHHCSDGSLHAPYATSRPTALVALAVGVALVDALAPLVPGHELGIHWPNDVMLDGRKLAGILIEVLPGGKQVIGIGINTNNTAVDAPEEVRHRVATLRDASGRMYDPVETLTVVLTRLEEQLAELAHAPERVAARTNELCLQRGRRLAVAQGGTRIEGRCLGIAADGALLMECDSRHRRVYSGTVEVI